MLGKTARKMSLSHPSRAPQMLVKNQDFRAVSPYAASKARGNGQIAPILLPIYRPTNTLTHLCLCILFPFFSCSPHISPTNFLPQSPLRSGTPELLFLSGTCKRGVTERGVFAFACQYIVCLRGQTGNHTVTQMRHPLLVSRRIKRGLHKRGIHERAKFPKF